MVDDRRPPYPGCTFMAVIAADTGFRFVSAWRSEEGFREVLDTLLAQDLTAVGLEAADVQVAPAVSMAIPGPH